MLEKKKTVTSSLYILYTYEKESLPKKGDYSLICDINGEAKTVIKNINVDIIPFKDVNKDIAKKEGEGDLSLEYWRKAHKEFFINELKDTPFVFSDDILVVCEELVACNS